MEKKKYKTVDAYFKDVPPQALDRMKEIREAVKGAAPLATEVISYNMPALKYNNSILVYYAAYANHIGFYAIPTTHTAFAKALATYKTGKGSVQFPHDAPLPLDLIAAMTQFRYAQKLKMQK